VAATFDSSTAVMIVAADATCGAADADAVTGTAISQTVSTAAANAASYGWNAAQTPSPASGSYKVCWCGAANDCLTAKTGHRYHVGTVVFVGPNALPASVYCTSTAECKVTLASTVLESANPSITANTLFASPTALMVKSGSCGTGGSVVNNAPKTDGTITVTSASQIDYSWKDLTLWPTPGSYRVCWCRATSTSTCTAASDFNWDIGGIVVAGR
jgi:hypothetical protein